MEERLRPVVFEGTELAKLNTIDDRGSRGTREVLYQTTDGQYIVHVTQWSHWQGETTDLGLYRVSLADLDVNGEYEALGREAGLARDLTLDDVLV